MRLFKATERLRPWKGTSSEIAEVIERASTLASDAEGLVEPKTQVVIGRSRSETELSSADDFRAHVHENRISDAERILIAAGEDAKAAETNEVKFLILVDIDARPVFGAVDVVVQGTNETYVEGTKTQLLDLLGAGRRGLMARLLYSEKLAAVGGAVLGFAIGSTAVAGLTWITGSAFGVAALGGLLYFIGRRLVPPIELVDIGLLPRAQMTRTAAFRVAKWVGGLAAAAVISALVTKLIGD